MSTLNDDEADRSNGTYDDKYEENPEYQVGQGIGYKSPPNYQDHEDHQQPGNANPPGAAPDENDPTYGLGGENSAPNQTDAPEDVPRYDKPEPQATHDAGGGTVFHKGGVVYQGKEFVRETGAFDKK